MKTANQKELTAEQLRKVIGGDRKPARAVRAGGNGDSSEDAFELKLQVVDR